jgi:Xaa-Pro dipeptidase
MKYEFDTSYRIDNYGVGMMGTDWGERIDFNRMRNDRLQKVKSAIEESEVDVLIAARWENVRYMTGHRTHMWPVMWWGLTQSVLLRGAPKALLYTMDEEHVDARMPWMEGWCRHAPGAGLEDEIETARWAEAVLGEIAKMGLKPKRIAVDAWSPAMHAVLPKIFGESYPGVEFVNGQTVMLKARQIKTEDEIACLRIADQMTIRGMAAARKLIHEKPGIKECEVLSAAFKEMYDMGSEWTQCSNIVCSGPYTFPYRRMTSDRMIEPGDFVIVDIGACFNGYWGDFTRVWIAGGVKPSQDQKEVFQTSYRALQESIKKLKEGHTTWDVCKAAIDTGGLHGGFLGHGDGLGAAEPPWIATYSKDDPVELKNGMVFSIEPFAGKRGVGGVRLEENVVVRPDAPEILSKFPYEESLFD